MFFYRVMLDILILHKKHPERIIKKDKKLVKHITNPKENYTKR